MAKTKVVNEAHSNNKLKMMLAQYGLADSLRLVEDLPDMEVETFSSGIPSVDYLINELNPGLPRGRDIEVFSRDGSAGKTSWSLKVIKAAQDQGLLVAFVDVENTMTIPYLRAHGIKLTYEECPEGIYPLTILRAKYDPKTDTYENLSLELVLDAVRTGSQKMFDLMVVDSVDAMVEQSQIEKTAEENHKQGGIAKKMGEFLRKNTAKKATVIWLNQTRQAMSSGPSYTGPIYIPSGGRALAFYASVRLQLDMVKKLEETDKDPYGFTTKITLVKNKVGPRWRSTEINYINGTGFSTTYDYLNLALSNKVIIKSGSWFISEELGIKCQGLYNMYRRIESDENGSLTKLKALYDTAKDLIEEVTPDQEIEKEQTTYNEQD